MNCRPSLASYLRATLLMLGILALVVVLGLALAGCGLTPNDGKVHIGDAVHVTRGEVTCQSTICTGGHR